MPDRYERDDPTLYDLAYDQGTGMGHGRRQQVQDQWGRAPGHPAYGQPPGYGNPAAGYGPGGVNNPAYRGPGATGTTPPPGATPPPGGTPPGTTPPPADGSRWAPNYRFNQNVASTTGSRFEGFNSDRARMGGDAKSTKDLFFNVINPLNIDLRTAIGTGPDAMERAERLSRETIIPALRAAGADVLDAKKDKILIRTAENPDGEWVDIYGDAGGGDPRFWWGAESPTAAAGVPGAAAPGGPVGTTQPGVSGKTPGVSDVAYRELAQPSTVAAGDSLFDLAYLYNPEAR